MTKSVSDLHKENEALREHNRQLTEQLKAKGIEPVPLNLRKKSVVIRTEKLIIDGGRWTYTLRKESKNKYPFWYRRRKGDRSKGEGTQVIEYLGRKTPPEIEE